jgi:hypothetical protein
MIFQTKSSRFLSAYSPQKYRLIEVKFGDRKIIGKYCYERVCNKSYGALRTFMQNNPIWNLYDFLAQEIGQLNCHDIPRKYNY